MHALAIFVFCGIAALEMAVINHADKVSENRITDLQSKIGTTLDTTTRIQTILTGSLNSQALERQAQEERQKRHKVSDELIELKARAAKLSADIFSLLLLRSQMSGDVPIRRETFEQDAAKRLAFDEETVLWYRQKYEASVRQVVEDLKKNRLEDARLEMAVRDTFGVRDVEIIANHLSAQAARITPDGIKPVSGLLAP